MSKTRLNLTKIEIGIKVLIIIIESINKAAVIINASKSTSRNFDGTLMIHSGKCKACSGASHAYTSCFRDFSFAASCWIQLLSP